jgi:hypothetical protein
MGGQAEGQACKNPEAAQAEFLATKGYPLLYPTTRIILQQQEVISPPAHIILYSLYGIASGLTIDRGMMNNN